MDQLREIALADGSEPPCPPPWSAPSSISTSRIGLPECPPPVALPRPSSTSISLRPSISRLLSPSEHPSGPDSHGVRPTSRFHRPTAPSRPTDVSAITGPSAACTAKRRALPCLRPREGVWISFYGASRQDTPPLHAVRSRFDGQRSLFPPPGTFACGVRWKARGWLSPLGGRDSRVYRNRFVLRSRAGTILLSGALGPIASFGSPGGHSLSRGTRAGRPGPAIQWMLSPEPLRSRNRYIGATPSSPLLRPGSVSL
jgi:hypothetical protein